MGKIDVSRLAATTLVSGFATDPTDQTLCVMQAISYIMDEQGSRITFCRGDQPLLVAWSDKPGCVDPHLISAGIMLNDRLSDARRQTLKTRIPRLIGTRDDGLAEARAIVAADWMIRRALPALAVEPWLTEAMRERLLALADLTPITTRAQVYARGKRLLAHLFDMEVWGLRPTRAQDDLALSGITFKPTWAIVADRLNYYLQTDAPLASLTRETMAAIVEPTGWWVASTGNVNEDLALAYFDALLALSNTPLDDLVGQESGVAPIAAPAPSESLTAAFA